MGSLNILFCKSLLTYLSINPNGAYKNKPLDSFLSSLKSEISGPLIINILIFLIEIEIGL